MDLAQAVKTAEKRAIEKAIRRAEGNRNLAARLLGISRRSLYYKLEEYGIE
jgi:transcriptional regulator with PAS, ATPase and Fis domain